MPMAPNSAPANARIRNTEKSNMGRGLRFSTKINATKLNTVAAAMLNAAGLPNPRSAPCVMR